MTADPLTLSPEDSLMEARQIMQLRKIRRIPVVSGGRLVGLVAQGDVKRAEPSTLTATQEEFVSVMEGTLIAQIMMENLVTTTPDTPLKDAARALWKNKYGALPVLEGEKLVGILTDNDLIGALLKLLDAEA
jgi:CBS domain-containing protein